MATLVLSAIGTAIGGPLGGALGALIGSQVDQTIFKPGAREGARLKELRVTTSSYGTPIARHYGRVRSSGSIIWATDLVESTEKDGGGKGKPSTTSYSYSTSFAVALASRPVKEVGRIWADGNLLRGESGDLKTGGEMRFYDGHADQQVDPLIAADKGADAPAFRGLAYVVFEGLQLADFGNRIPGLTFEVIADDRALSLARMFPADDRSVIVDRSLDSLVGYSDEGGPLIGALQTIHQVYPLVCDTGGAAMTIAAADIIPAQVPMLPQAAADPSDESFAVSSGASRKRGPEAEDVPDALRYYDTARDFQPGLQRAEGRARAGRSRVIEFPGSLEASNARDLANRAASRAASARELLSYRIAELDPSLAPGQVVAVPGRSGHWLVENWEWRETGVELELLRLPHGPARSTPADPGTPLAPPDRIATPTQLVAYELPWDGTGSSEQRQIFAAVSSSSSGWTGAALYTETSGGLQQVGTSGRTRSVIGTTSGDLSPGNPAVIDGTATLEVMLASVDFELIPSGMDALAGGANRALLGEEIVQFSTAVRIEDARWRIGGILRGRGGTERFAAMTKAAGTPFVLLDQRPLALDAVAVGEALQLAAIGLADSDPVTAPILEPGATLRPLTPVHPRHRIGPDGALSLGWTRRARGTWEWRDGIETPLNEQGEHYLIGLGSTQSPALVWEASEPSLDIAPELMTVIAADHPGKALWVRQIGARSSSPPLLLFTIP